MSGPLFKPRVNRSKPINQPIVSASGSGPNNQASASLSNKPTDHSSGQSRWGRSVQDTTDSRPVSSLSQSSSQSTSRSTDLSNLPTSSSQQSVTSQHSNSHSNNLYNHSYNRSNHNDKQSSDPSNSRWGRSQLNQESHTSRTNHQSKNSFNYRSNDRSYYQPSGRPTNQSVDRPINQSTDEDSLAIDREWYDADEGSAVADDQFDESAFADLTNKQSIKRSIKQSIKQSTSQSIKQTKTAARQADIDDWELQQMGQRGPKPITRDCVIDDLVEEKVELLVRDIKPPFLADKFPPSIKQSITQPADQSTNQALNQSIKYIQPLVSVVKDDTNDFAKLARKGSPLLASMRDKAERDKMKHAYWEIAGNRIGSAIGLTNKVDQSDNQSSNQSDDQSDFRKDSQFASHIQSINQTGQSEFSQTKSIIEQRESLPIFTVKSDLLRVIADHPVTVLVGETGSGKTTQLTQYLIEAGYAAGGVIGCTQPRRVAAMSVAQRVATERGVTLGEEVGYSIRFEDVSSENTKILYLTEGLLLRECLTSSDLGRYSVIVMDEAHERALNTDVLFGLMKQVLRTRRDIKLIVTSATLNADRFSQFFGGAPVFKIPGRTFPVDIVYTKSPAEDYLDAAVKQVLQVHLSQPRGDILVFMSGQEDIECACVRLAEQVDEIGGECPPLCVLPLYSQLPADLQAKIFLPAGPGERKVVIATNVAETSLTIDGIRYVIDIGYSKLKVYNPRIGLDSLQLTPISRASADQRAGRAGRTGPGVAYRLYTKHQYEDEMLLSSVPEIQRTNLSSVVLLLKSFGVTNVGDFDLMDRPPDENIHHSEYQLWLLDALDDQGSLTTIGRRMVEFPIDPPLSAFLFAAQDLGCVDEALTIVAMLSLPSVFFRPRDRAAESDAARERFVVEDSDHCTLLHVYQQWLAHGCSESWCTQHFIHGKALKKVRQVRGQLSEICTTLKIEETSCGQDWSLIRQALARAYYSHAARLTGFDQYVDMTSGLPCSLHPTSSLQAQGKTPDYIVYHELMATQKEYMRTVSAVQGEWLAEYGKKIFTIKLSIKKSLQAIEKRKREAMIQASNASNQSSTSQSESTALPKVSSNNPFGQQRTIDSVLNQTSAVIEVGEANKEERLERERKRRKMRLGGV